MYKNHNIISGYLCQFCNAVLAILFLPFFFSGLSAEEFGLIGLFTLIQSLFSIVELGNFQEIIKKTQLLNKNIENGGKLYAYVKNIKIVLFTFGISIVTINIMCINFFDLDLLKYNELNQETFKNSLVLIVLIIALRLFEGAFRSLLYGLNSQLWYNYSSIITSILRYSISLLLINETNSIVNYFIWQFFISFILVILLNYKINHLIIKNNKYKYKYKYKYKFKYIYINFLYIFSNSYTNILYVSISILLINIDKIYVANNFILGDFGNYMLATNAASVLFLIVVPITQALIPEYIKLYNYMKIQILLIKYINMERVIKTILISLAVNGCIFSEGILYFWSGNMGLVNSVGSLFSILILAYFFNALIYLHSQIMIINGFISVNLKLSTLMLISSTLIYILISNFNDINYVAYLTLFINLLHYVIVLFYINKILFMAKIKYYYFISLSFTLLLTYIVASFLKLIAPANFNNNRIEWLFFVAISIFICFISNILADKIIYKKLCN